MSCENKDCDERCFKKPKSYAAIMKEHRDLMIEHTDSLKQIESLRSLNASLIQKIKTSEKKVMDAEKKAVNAEKQAINAEKQALESEEQRKVFLRTYTNMSIEMLKLEDKLAKYEGRQF